MYYLINKSTGEIVEENETKSRLRKKQKTMKNRTDYKVSKFKPGEGRHGSVKSKVGRGKGFSARWNRDRIAKEQAEIDERVRKHLPPWDLFMPTDERLRKIWRSGKAHFIGGEKNNDIRLDGKTIPKNRLNRLSHKLNQPGNHGY